MSAEKLAFLQNFYTDVTLYVPAEPAVAELLTPEPAPVEATAATEPIIAAESTAATEPMIVTELIAATESVAAAEAPATPVPAVLPELRAIVEVPPAPAAAGAPEPPRPPYPIPELAPVVARPPLPPPQVVAEPPASPPLAPVLLTQFTTLGSNPQGVVLLFRLPQGQFLKLHRNVFLNKMLQALGLVMADIVLVNVESDLPVALVNLRREMAATQIVAFGKNLLDVTIRNTQIYEPVHFPSLSLSYLASATVDLIEYDVSLKKRLWPGLQRMFLG